jgi:yecA family protein
MTDTPSEKRAKTIALRKKMQTMVEKAVRPKNRKKLLHEAQDLVYQAWEAPSRKRAVELARRALELSDDCVDAYCILAENQAKTDDEAILLFRQGVEAGRRALGEKAFREDVGHFWGLLETRPFMRAMDGLATILRFTEGKEGEAIDIWLEMLRLNPGDNQGARYRLLALLVELNRDDDAGALLAEYGDDFLADWAYARALLAFRREGDTEATRALLEKALEKNRHVPHYFLGRKKLPKKSDDFITPGEESEAVACCESYLVAWFRTPGALEWLARQSGVSFGPKPRRPSLFAAEEKKHLMELLKLAAVPDDALSLEELHGFLFGLAITPEVVKPSEWLPLIFGEEMLSLHEEKKATRLLERLFDVHNRLIDEQNAGRLRFPFSMTNSAAMPFVQDWCYGLFIALTMRPQVWGIEDGDLWSTLEKAEGAAFAAAVVTVVGIPETLEELGGEPGTEPLTEEDKDDFYLSMLERLPEAVAALCAEGRNSGVRRRREAMHVAPHQPKRVEKIGRNDPCPCGSGKKYKKCCG